MHGRASIFAIFLTLITQPSLAQNWDGYYAGVLGGFVDSKINQIGTSIPGGPPPTVGNSTGNFKYQGNEGEYGFFGGRNYQVKNRIQGWEISVSKGGKAALSPAAPPPEFYNSYNEVSVNLAFRYGVLWDSNTLLYVTGGPTYLHNDLDWSFTFNETINQDLLGLTIGGGIEHRLGVGNLRAEAVYSAYITEDYTSINFPNVLYSDDNERVLVRVGYSIPLGRRQR